MPRPDELDQTRPNATATWRTSSKHNVVVLDSGPLVPRYENITLSTKPEVHDVSQRRHRMTEPGPYRQHAEKWQSSNVWFSTYAKYFANRQTDIQTDRYTHRNTLHPPEDKLNISQLIDRMSEKSVYKIMRRVERKRLSRLIS